MPFKADELNSNARPGCGRRILRIACTAGRRSSFGLLTAPTLAVVRQIPPGLSNQHIPKLAPATPSGLILRRVDRGDVFR